MSEVTLKAASRDDMPILWKMQIEAFSELLQKYRDYDTSPGAESLERVTAKAEQAGSFYFFITVGDEIVGGIRIADGKDGIGKRISPIWIMPEHRNKRYAQAAISEAERIFGAGRWSLDTILQEEGNLHLYEKMGYRRTGRIERINERMDIVFLEKDVPGSEASCERGTAKYDIKPCGESDAELIWDKCFEAVPTEGNAPEERLVFKIADASGNIVGGCVLDIDGTKTAEFERLWVEESRRGRGMGAALIRAAEKAAREKGCRTAVNAYTFDFQNAKPLFERLGYRLIGTVKDWPKGHESYTLIKKLGGPEESFPAVNTGFEILPGSEEDGAFITERLEEFNRAFAPRSHEYLDLDKAIVDENGNIVAGCVAGVSGWDTLHIDAFWADAAHYDASGYLLENIEREAKKLGAYLAAASFPERQAAFFKERGYSVQVVFEDEPKWCVMYKRL